MTKGCILARFESCGFVKPFRFGVPGSGRVHMNQKFRAIRDQIVRADASKMAIPVTRLCILDVRQIS